MRALARTGVPARFAPFSRILRIAFALAVAAGCGLATGARAQAATACYPATSVAAHALCFFDFSAYSGTGTLNFSSTLPDGSTLTGTLTNNTATAETTSVAPVYGTGTFGGVAFGDEDYLGVLGKPVFYTGATTPSMTLSNLVLTDTAGRVVSPVTIVGVDGESTDSGDGTNGNIGWTTTGTIWSQLQLMPNPAGSIANVCNLSGTGTRAVTCTQNGTGAPNAAYIFSTQVTNAQTVTMSARTGNSKQGFAFGIELATLRVAKTIVARENTADQFTVQVVRNTTVAASASTTGTGTTASTAPTVVVPADSYVLNEIAASGSGANLGNYVSTIACANANTGSSTTLPTSGSVATSATITPAIDDQISCTFTNTPLTLTDTASANKTVTAGTSTTDVFTLKNTSTIAGTFTIVAPTIVGANGSTFTPSGYTFNGTTYTTLAALQSAINAAGATAAGGSIAVGVVYTVPGTAGATAAVTLPATINSGTSASPQATATETDTITPTATLTISKTGTTATSPGGLIAYSILVGNSGPSPANGALFSDPVPTGITITGTPACGSATGGAACGTVSVNGQTVSSTITTFPVGGSVTFTINGSAGTAASYTNTASVAPPSGTGGGTQTSSLTTTIAQSNGLQKTVANITSGTAASTADTAKPGDTLRYVLTFTNTTGAALTAMSFSDVVPANTGFVAAQCPAPSTTLPSGVTCSTTVPAVGSTGTTVKVSYTGSIANGATITASLDVKVF